MKLLSNAATTANPSSSSSSPSSTLHLNLTHHRLNPLLISSLPKSISTFFSPSAFG